jgi:glutathione S-transferase
MRQRNHCPAKSHMKLHYSPTSPFARMVLVTAHEVGLADKITLLHAGAVPPTEVHPVITPDNPLGKVPCLVTDHGHALYDSRVICEYLAHHGGRELFPDEPVKRFRVLTLQALAQGICDAGVSFRYETGSLRASLRASTR